MGLHNPSSAERFLNCPGSVMLTKDCPYTSSEAARKGTAAHAVAEQCLREGTDTWAHLGQMYLDPRDRGAYPAIEITFEMISHVQSYLDYVRALAVEIGSKINVEERLNLDHIYPGINGLVDVWLSSPDCQHLVIIDLKYGVGFVGAFANEQMMIYASMLLGREKTKRMFKDVSVVIYQPRSLGADGLPYRRWDTTRAALENWAQETLKPGILATMDPNAPLVPGDKQCHWCPGKQLKLCPAVAELALAPLGGSVAAFTSPIKPALPVLAALTPRQRGDMLAAIKDAGLEAWIAGLKDAVKEETRKGVDTGWKFVPGRNERLWTNPDMAAAALASTLDIAPRTIMSPFKVEEALKEQGYRPKDVKGMIEPLTTKVPGESLVRNNDTREATDIMSGFRQLEN